MPWVSNIGVKIQSSMNAKTLKACSSSPWKISRQNAATNAIPCQYPDALFRVREAIRTRSRAGRSVPSPCPFIRGCSTCPALFCIILHYFALFCITSSIRPTFSTFDGICMEEHTYEARLTHINGNVVRNSEMSETSGGTQARYKRSGHVLSDLLFLVVVK